MVREASRTPDAPALVNLPDPGASAPLFAPLRDLDKRGRILIAAFILLANIPVLHYLVRHVIGENPVTATVPFIDDFNRPELGPNYWYQGGDWRIVDGQLYVNGSHQNAAWLQASLPHDVAIEFDAKPLSPEVDVRFEIFGDGQNHGTGYIFYFSALAPYMNSPVRGTSLIREDEGGLIFGADGRAISSSDPKQAAVAGRTMDELWQNGTLGPSSGWRMDRGDVRGVPNETYHMRIERKGGHLTWMVNGQVIYDVTDKYPLGGKHHDRFGFSSYDATVAYDNLSIQPL